MGSLWSAMRRGTRAVRQSFVPGQYTSAGKKLLCPHCGGDEFAKGSVQLNTAGMTFLNLDLTNKSATMLACTACGRMGAE